MKDKTKEKWKKVGKKIAGIGLPLLGSVLGGPAGGALGGTVASALGLESDDPDAVMKALDTDTEAAVKLAEIQAKHKEELERIELGYAQAAVEQVKAVNMTMQAEAKSDKPIVYSWRPFNGYAFGITLFCVYFVLPFWKAYGVEVPEIPAEVFLMWGAILGVASWDRGKEKRKRAGEDYQGLAGIFKKNGD